MQIFAAEKKLVKFYFIMSLYILPEWKDSANKLLYHVAVYTYFIISGKSFVAILQF